MSLLLLSGWLMLVPAGGLLMASLAAPVKMAVFLESLRTAGLTPTALVTIAVIVIGVAILRGRQANIELRVGDMEAALLDNDTGMSASLDYLVEAQEHHTDRPPASGEELERVLLVLQRQDEKVNNLTRAIKMYGKPLIEITKQMADVTARIEALRSSVGTIAETVDISGLETALAGMSEGLQKQIGGELDKILSEVSKQDDDTLTKMLAELKQEMSQMASSVQRLQQSGMARPATQTSSGPAAAPSSGDPSHQDPSHSGHAHSISGTRTSSGKGVLGSIAKLKKMRQ
jgi:prefoldin subunit 5